MQQAGSDQNDGSDAASSQGASRPPPFPLSLSRNDMARDNPSAGAGPSTHLFTPTLTPTMPTFSPQNLSPAMQSSGSPSSIRIGNGSAQRPHYPRRVSGLGFPPYQPRPRMISISGTGTREPVVTPSRLPSRTVTSTGGREPSVSLSASQSRGWTFGSHMSSSQGLDDLANWSTLQNLIEDTVVNPGSPSQGSVTPGRTPVRSSTRNVTRHSSRLSLRSMFGPSGAQDIPRGSPLAGGGGFDSEFSAVLSTSPTGLDTGTPLPSFSAFFDSPRRGSPLAASESALDTVPELPDSPEDTVPLLPSVVPPDQEVEQKRIKVLPWPPPAVAIAIFKCSLAYLVASLFTFVPFFAEFLSLSSETDAHGRVTRRPAYSAHMVATIVVYFNPAKTIGSMILSTRYCIFLASLAAMVSLLSIGTIHLFDHYSPSGGGKWEWVSEVGDWIVCVLYIGGSMAGLAWAKVWVGNPSFNTGCSMAAVTLFTVVVKEGGIVKLAEVISIVVLGAIITNLVCFLVFPESATSRLQGSISKSLTSFSTLLDLLTTAFLLEKTSFKENRMPLAEAVKSHAAAFQSLKNNLAEAKHERIIDSRIRGRRLELYDAALGSMARLAQHLNGLRSSTRLQEELIRAAREGLIQFDLDGEEKEQYPNGHLGKPTVTFASDDGGMDNLSLHGALSDIDIDSSVRLFRQFQSIAGADMSVLVTRCDDALDGIEGTIRPQSGSDDNLDLPRIRSVLASAIKDFTRSSSIAIKRVYAGPRREKGVYVDGESDDDEEGVLGPAGGVGVESIPEDGPNEVVFLIYFFLFTFEEFARELLFLIDTVVEIIDAPSLSTMEYLKSRLPHLAGGRFRGPRGPKRLYKEFQKLVPIDPSQLQPPLFPRKRKDAPGTLLTPGSESLTFWERIRQWFWAFSTRLSDPDMRYAIKTGVAGAMLAAPAFIERTRPIFLEYRGEWALISFFATMSPTVGQTNFLSFFRVTGTLLGATVAVIAYTMFPENPILLPIFGFIFSMPCFYIITQMPDYAQAGRFILLTYNLTCLYAYNQREKDLSPISIAFHRSSSVIIGVIWAGFVSRYWWPFTARRELRMGLGDFCLDLSYLYSKLVTTYSRGVDPPDPSIPLADGEEEPLLPVGAARHPHIGPGVRQFMAMELHLQNQLTTLRELLKQTYNEPRLKGPFAVELYQEVLLSCQRIVDRLHSMRCVTTRDEWDNGIRRAFVIPVNHLRREMAGSVILYLYTLSAGFRLRTPMPPYLPPAERARQRLVDAIRDLDVVKRRSVRGGGRHLLFFAYALAMQEVIAELDFLGNLLQEAFGVISQSTVQDFEALFAQEPEVTVETV